MEVPNDPTLSFLGIYLKDSKLAYHRDSCTSVMTARPFNTLSYSPMPINRGIKEIWGMCIMGFYSAGKRMELESIMVAKIKQIWCRGLNVIHQLVCLNTWFPVVTLFGKLKNH